MAYARKKIENVEGLINGNRKKFVRYDEGAELFSMGLHSFEQLAREANAVYKIRRIALVNVEIVEEYLENYKEI